MAETGEELVMYRFPTGSLGMTSPSELEMYKPEFHGWWSSFDARQVPCAVCIPHGSQLRLSDIPERIQQKLGVGAEEEVTFIQLSADVGRHRDGIRFANGQEILLQRMAEGQHARVLSLTLREVEYQTSDAVVQE
ncbi:MAG TPA: hypothetical protein VKT49_12745 [Bryobacteraceae bacterium]|nr:hypothetical protein [Bryobacteraceae bacterium]